jgi:hypothetical protein
MKIFGSISELVDLAFRLAGGKQVKLRSATQTTAGSTVTVNVPDVAATGDTQNMILTNATQTLTNKTLTSPVVSGGTINNSIIGGSTPAAGTFTDIVGSTLDINTSAELQTLTIPSLSTAGVLHNNSSGAVSSSLVVNADVDAAAAIAFSKLATLASGNILVGSNTGVATSRAVTGDVTISDLGVTAIGASKVTDSMLAGNIARTKLATGNNYRILANDSSGAVSENAALTANEAVATDANGQLVSVTGVSATELGYLSGVTSDVQTQIDSKQAADATLTAIAGVTTAADKYIYFDGVDSAQAATITSFARGLLDDTSATIAQNTLGLGSMSTQAATSVNITGGTIQTTNLQNNTLNGHKLGSGSASIASSTLTPASNKSLQLIASAANFGMIASPSDGQEYVLVNESASDITIQNLTGATAANQIYTGTGADFTFKAKSAVSVVYDGTLSKWMLTGGGGGAGGLATTYVTAGGITAVKNTHYLTNLAASGQTITLPAGVDGDVIRFSDAGEVWDVYPLTIAPASGEKIDKLAIDETLVCDVKRGWVELSYNSTFGGWAFMSLASSSGSASGSGEINAVLNASAAADTTGWTNATRVSSGSPLDPVVTTALSISNVAASEGPTSGGYYSIATMPASLRSRKLKLEFYYSTPATDVYKVSVYAGSTRLSLSSDNSGATSLPANVTGGFFSASFDATTASAYTLNITRTSGTTGAITVTNVVVGPGIVAQGAAISEWQSYTPASTQGFGNPTATVYRYKRSGSSIIVSVKFTAGTVTTDEARISLPSGLTSATTNALTMVGAYARGTGTTASANQVYIENGAAYLTFGRADGTLAGYAKRQGSQLVSAGEDFGFTTAEIPIAEWAGNGTVNLGQGANLEYAFNSSATTTTDTTSFGYGPTGAAFAAFAPGGTASVDKRVRFQYPIQQDDELVVEVQEAGTGTWVPLISRLGAFYSNAAGTTYYGTQLIRVSGSSTDVDVAFYAAAPSQGAWSSLSTWKWRVRKAKASAPVGFGLATADQAGLLRGYSNMSKIRLNTGNGYGSTNTAIRRFTNTVVNTGTGITYADSATLGATFTVNEAGIYAISYSDGFNAAAAFGISLNSTQLTTAIATITAADRLCMSVTSAADYHSSVSVTLALSVGDVIRAHAGTADSTAPVRTQFTIQRIG